MFLELQIVKMEDKMENMAEGQESMKKQISSSDSKMEKMTKQISSLDNKVEKINSDMIKAFALGWNYEGRGYEGSGKYDGYAHIQDATTFNECLRACDKKHTSESTSWNGMVWGQSHKWCGCVKNDRGHTPDGTYLHFKTI